MKNKYTKKQILEAINYWTELLKLGNYKKLNEEFSIPGYHTALKQLRTGLIKGLSALEAKKITGLDLVEFKYNESGLSGKSCVARISDRPVVVVKTHGILIPFYISTGNGGKEKVATGKWYMIFGVPNKIGIPWINKGTQDLINDCYGLDIVKKIKSVLDAKLNLDNLTKPFKNGNQFKNFKDLFIPSVVDCTNAYEAINSLIDGAPYNSEHDPKKDNYLKFKNVINKIKVAIKGVTTNSNSLNILEVPLKTFSKIKQSWGQYSTLANKFGSDKRFWGDPQFETIPTGGNVTCIPNTDAENLLCVNGKPAMGSFIMKPGMILSIGSKKDPNKLVCKFKLV